MEILSQVIYVNLILYGFIQTNKVVRYLFLIIWNTN